MQMQPAEIERSARGRRLTYEDAMGNNLMNAIIELVTNADDSYCSIEDEGELSRTGKILIEIERHPRGPKPTILKVRDRAEGLSKKQIRKRIQREGDLHRSFRSEKRKRGLFGSGAKEVSHFGRTIFESIKDNQYTRYEIPRGGGNANDVPQLGSESPDRHREELGIPNGNGTVVTIFVESEQFTIPRYDTLKRRLQVTPQLQPILMDENRRVRLNDLGNEENADNLVVVEPQGEVVKEVSELEIPGYQDETEKFGEPTKLWIKRTDDPLDNSKVGLLISSGRTAFERDHLELRNKPHANRFFGGLDCPFLWRLIAEAEARDANDTSLLPNSHDDYIVERSKNPSRPVSRRRRSGLDRSHPFINKLRIKAKKILESERQRSLSQRAKERELEIGEELKQELNLISKKLGKFLEGTRPGEGKDKFKIIPGRKTILEGSSSSFTVQALNNFVEEAGNVVELLPEKGEELVEISTEEIELEPREGRDYHSKSFRVDALKEGEVEILLALGSEYQILPIHVATLDKAEPTELIEFDRNQYRVRADENRRTHVTVSLDPRLKKEIGRNTISLKLSGEQGINQAVSLSNQSPNLRDRNGNVPVAKTRLIGNRGGEGLQGEIKAKYDRFQCTAQVIVAAKEEVGEELPFDIKYRSGIEAEKRRYDWDQEGNRDVLYILTDHPSVKPYCEDVNMTDGKLSLTPALRALTREISAGAIAYRAVAEEEPDNSTHYDSEAILARYEEFRSNALSILYE